MLANNKKHEHKSSTVSIVAVVVDILFYTVFQKQGATKLMAVNSSNLHRFSKFFHHWKEKEMSILFPTTS